MEFFTVLQCENVITFFSDFSITDLIEYVVGVPLGFIE